MLLLCNGSENFLEKCFHSPHVNIILQSQFLAMFLNFVKLFNCRTTCDYSPDGRKAFTNSARYERKHSQLKAIWGYRRLRDIISAVEAWNGVALIKELHKLHTESKGSINICNISSIYNISSLLSKH